MKRTILAALCGLLVIGFAACSEVDYFPEELPTEAETEEPATEQLTLSSEDIAGLLAQTTPAVSKPAQVDDPLEEPQEAAVQGEFEASVFLAKADGDDTERFFFFYENGNGAYLEQETGTGMGFTYEMPDAGNAVFHIGDAASVTNAEIYWLDEDNVQISWENGGYEMLTRLPNDPHEPFHFYSNEVLRERAMDVYEQKNGFRPAEAATWFNFDGMISIQLVDNADGHEFICDWYTVDRFTGIGTNLMGEQINLSDTPDSVETTPAESIASEQTEASAETTETQTTTATVGRRR